LEKVEFLPKSTGVDLVIVQKVILDSPNKDHHSHGQESSDGNEKEKEEQVEIHCLWVGHGFDQEIHDKSEILEINCHESC
jgi:hypothetical protein